MITKTFCERKKFKETENLNTGNFKILAKMEMSHQIQTKWK